MKELNISKQDIVDAVLSYVKSTGKISLSLAECDKIDHKRRGYYALQVEAGTIKYCKEPGRQRVRITPWALIEFKKSTEV